MQHKVLEAHKLHHGDALQLKYRSTFKQKMHIMIDAAKGLRAMHEKGYLHRDFKSANILADIAEDGSAKGYVADLDTAMKTDDDNLGSLIWGTPGYYRYDQRGKNSTYDDWRAFAITLNDLFSPKDFKSFQVLNKTWTPQMNWRASSDHEQTIKSLIDSIIKNTKTANQIIKELTALILELSE